MVSSSGVVERGKSKMSKKCFKKNWGENFLHHVPQKVEKFLGDRPCNLISVVSGDAVQDRFYLYDSPPSFPRELEGCCRAGPGRCLDLVS